METSGLWSKQNAADFLFSEMISDPYKRKVKLNNWISRNHIPKNCINKIGKEIFFFKDELKLWTKQKEN